MDQVRIIESNYVKEMMLPKWYPSFFREEGIKLVIPKLYCIQRISIPKGYLYDFVQEINLFRFNTGFICIH